ncbi:four-carbon acid sugar kinase family protein [Metabacillus sp. RGM 3146]|uniref:four-carbon acid sugar kinase family protein n=1 Tax=Metabacillus sp. RGM 3146 TaxID=3401092 RepID=UPI003B9D5CE5
MRIGIIADDLTGANATGVGLAKQGFSTATIVQNTSFHLSEKYNAICIDTDSRYARKDIAENRVKEALHHLKQWGADVFCKRIDSTIRGNIGFELDTVLNGLGEDSIGIVVPSFPASGRVTVGGYLLVEGIAVQETDAARDPITPIEKSFVPALIEKQSQYPVASISLDIVLSGKEAILRSVKNKIAEGSRIIVIDAVNDEHIEVIANAMVQIQDRVIVPVDPGPLTANYAKACIQKLSNDQRIIAAVGSATSLTGQQLDYLIAKTNSNPVYVDPYKLASYSDSWQNEVDRAVAMGLDFIKKEKILIITTYLPDHTRLDLKALSENENVMEDALAKRITDGLAAITRKIIQRTGFVVSGCFTSGGDVTASFCAVSYAAGIQLEDEVFPLAAYGRFIGGHLPNLPVVTKGGMIGDIKAIYRCVRFLQMKNTNLKRSVLDVSAN